MKNVISRMLICPLYTSDRIALYRAVLGEQDFETIRNSVMKGIKVQCSDYCIIDSA